MSIFDEEIKSEFIKSTPSNVGGVQHFAEIHAGAGAESMHVNKDGFFIGAETYADAPVKIPYTGKMKVGSASVYFEWDGSNFNVVGGDIQTALTGYRVKLSSSGLQFYYDNSLKGSIGADSGGSMVYTSYDNHYFRDGSSELARFTSLGLELPAGHAVSIGGFYNNDDYSHDIITSIYWDDGNNRLKARRRTYTFKRGINTDVSTETTFTVHDF